MKRSEALSLRSLLERLAAQITNNTDAANATVFYPRLKNDGSLIEFKTRINWHGVTMMARQALYDYEQYNPDNAPNLWAAIRQRNGIRYIEENMPAELAFGLGEHGWWNDELYESLMEGNAYTPAVVPSVWRKV